MITETLTHTWTPTVVEAQAPVQPVEAQADGDDGSELGDEELENVAGGRSELWLEDFLRTQRGENAIQ